MLDNVALRPPILSTAATGTITIAININIPWTKSVQHTAKNPPAKVYDTTTKTAINNATL